MPIVISLEGGRVLFLGGMELDSRDAEGIPEQLRWMGDIDIYDPGWIPGK